MENDSIKKEYLAPTLKCYGNIADLTQAGGSSTMPDNSAYWDNSMAPTGGDPAPAPAGDPGALGALAG